MRALLFALFVSLLAACGGGGSDPAPFASPQVVDATPTPEAVAPSSTAPVWTVAPDILGACCNYSSLISAPDGWRVYTNHAPDGHDGDLQLYRGGVATQVLHITDPRDTYIRTSAVILGADGKYYGLAYTGDAYPSQGGYSPSWITSDDGESFTWAGPIGLYGRIFSGAGALVRDSNGGFRAWLDFADQLHEMRSPSGLPGTWSDVGAFPSGTGTLWASAAGTPNGIMVAVATGFPTESIALWWQCQGGPWVVLDHAAPIVNGQKGTALTYADGQIHAYSLGKHWTTQEPACA